MCIRDRVVVENGGDLYLWGRAPRVAALYAGADHPLTGRVGLRLTAEHEAAVVELGMSHAGEIAVLTRLARPDIALITNIGTSHIGNLG